MDQNTISKSWPGAITAITLIVEDLEAATEFYGKVFGNPVVFKNEDCTVYKFANTLINLLLSSSAVELLAPAPVASREASSRAVFTITVENVDELAAELVSRGVSLLNGPMDRPWGIRTASFIDPGGYVWEIAADL